MSLRHIAAVDLGASSGRVILASYNSQTHSISLQEVHRFVNRLIEVDRHHCWDLEHLEAQIVIGLNKLDDDAIRLDSIGIDTWGVDYVLLDCKGKRLGRSYAYRDHRTDGVMARVQAELGRENIYRRTGIQFLPFNTLYQLKAMMENKPEWLDQVTDFVMIPDYLAYRLTGNLNCEYTNATTTQLININTDNWDDVLLDYIGVPRTWFRIVRHPGNEIGHWQSKQGQQVPVISVASHDTASAVISSPLIDKHSAYLSSGTWSLMGVDTLTVSNCNKSLEYNITNEGGIDGHYRVLKNIMGLWLFQRICHEHNIQDIKPLIIETEKVSPFKRLINPNHERFINPVSMTEEIQQACKENHQSVPETVPELARCIFDSLALFYRQVIEQLSQLQNLPIKKLHIVGGGSQNNFLNQLCADTCQLNVTAGPIEASTLGNIGCQLMALNEIADVNQFRKIIAKNFAIREFMPQNSLDFDKASQLFCALY